MNAKQSQEQFDLMWNFAQMGGWEKGQANINTLKDSCEFIRKAMTQKTAGQRKDSPNDVDWDDLETHINIIAIETMLLYLSGVLDEVKEIMKMDTRYKEIHNECDMLEGDINRMFVSDDKDEVIQSMYYALNRLRKIWKYNLDRFEGQDMGSSD